MATDTNADDGEKRTVSSRTAHGVRQTQLDGVESAALVVETPAIYSDERIDVSAYAYDDERGEVELQLGSDVEITLSLSPAAARELADRLMAGADAADSEPELGGGDA